MRAVHRIVAIVALLLACAGLQGCVGALTYGATDYEVQNPRVDTVPDAYKVFLKPAPQPVTTSRDLATRMGLPHEHRCEAGGLETWRYNSNGGTRWSGTLLMLVVIPLPLMVPTGSERAIFQVRDGNVVSVKLTLYEAGGCISYIGGGKVDCPRDRTRDEEEGYRISIDRRPTEPMAEGPLRLCAAK